MATINFTSGTIIPSSWLNDVDAVVYGVGSYGAVGNGVTDDTAAIQSALNAASAAGGGLVLLQSGKTYKVSSRLTIASYCGIVGDGSPIIYATAAGFNNTSLLLADRYANNSVVIDGSGLTIAPYTQTKGIVLKGFRIQSEVSGGRSVSAIALRNTVNPIVEDLEIFGFPVGCAVRAASLVGGRFQNNYIHDFTDNTNWGVGVPQITAFEIDNDLVNSVVSSRTIIRGNNINSLTVGATFLAAHGYQTDGVNVANTNSFGIVISDNTIDSVGEGVDCFGLSCIITNNAISNTYIYGLKLIHGAKNCTLGNNTIYNVGLAGIILSGSTTVGVGNTTGNTVNGCTVKNVNYNSAWTANDSACILFTDNTGTTGKPINNIVSGCFFDEGTNGKYGWLDNSTGSNNYGENNYFIAGAANNRRVLVTAGGGTSRFAGSATYQTNLV